MIERRSFMRIGGGALAAAVVSGFSRTASAADITTIDLGGATLFQGAGCNVIALAGPDKERRQGVPVDQGALMIDGGRAANADALLAAVRRTTGASRIATLINTHWHPDQTGANEAVGTAGGVILAHEKTAMYESRTVYSSVMFKGRLSPLPEKGRPTKTTRADGSMQFADRQIDYGYLPAAHTDGDLFVHIPSLNLLAAGGVVAAQSWPLLDYRNGAWLGGRVRALERLATIVKPDTRVVPADGRVMTGAEIVRHRDMYQKLFETMIGYLNMGLGADDAVRLKPLASYEAEFGDASAFTYGALKSMMIAYVPD